VAVGGPVNFQNLEVERQNHIGLIWLNRPDKRNALSSDMWADIPKASASLSADPEIRVIVVAGRGPAFCVGIDFEMLTALVPEGESEAQRRLGLYNKIKELQASFSALADSPKPVIAAVHGYCLGAGVDLVTACDIRVASTDVQFGVRETVIGLVADVGTLQRLPLIVGSGHVAEMVYSGRDIDAGRALQIGLVNSVHADQEATIKAALDLAGAIAANSPLVVQGAKKILKAADKSRVDAGLDHVALWNATFLLSDDLTEGVTAAIQKRKPNFQGK
jgi:enoyl-CoA hydratase